MAEQTPAMSRRKTRPVVGGSATLESMILGAAEVGRSPAVAGPKISPGVAPRGLRA